MSDQPEIKKPDPADFARPMLGRLPAIDERDRRFRMAAPPAKRTFRNWLSPGPVWDQGQTSQCVSYAVNRFLTSHRIVNKPPLPFEGFYKICQAIDEWPGEDYDGTSVRAGFKVLKDMGFVSAYGWATEAEAVVRQILEVGPVVVGTDWTEAMFTPDQAGYIWPKGRIAGGHAYILLGANTRRMNPGGSFGAVRMQNSWGAGWGDKGKAWISIDALQQLLDGLSGWPGEACTAAEIDIS